MDYCCLDSHSDGTHSLLKLNFSKSVPVEKQTHLHLGWLKSEYIFSWFSFLGEFFFYYYHQLMNPLQFLHKLCLVSFIVMCVLCVRFWDCSVCEWTARGSSQSHAQEVMQHADVSALRLLEVLMITLPQTLLQTYALTVTDYAFSSPGQSWDRKLFWNSHCLCDSVTFILQIKTLHSPCVCLQLLYVVPCVCSRCPGRWCSTAGPVVWSVLGICRCRRRLSCVSCCGGWAC